MTSKYLIPGWCLCHKVTLGTLAEQWATLFKTHLPCWRFTPGERGEGKGKGTHILRHTRMCCSNGSLFHKKSLNMGLFFPKFQKCKKWAYFLRKIHKNGYPFLSKWPLKWVGGFEARAAQPLSKPNLSTPLGFTVGLVEGEYMIFKLIGILNNSFWKSQPLCATFWLNIECVEISGKSV